jgi:hypothetical protein
MTPREKAIELVEQFSSVLMHDEVYDDSIKCALVAVDEILEPLNYHQWQNRYSIDYYTEVKHELQKL